MKQPRAYITNSIISREVKKEQEYLADPILKQSFPNIPYQPLIIMLLFSFKSYNMLQQFFYGMKKFQLLLIFKFACLLKGMLLGITQLNLRHVATVINRRAFLLGINPSLCFLNFSQPPAILQLSLKFVQNRLDKFIPARSHSSMI